jgi:uncharacterized membrane protein
VAAGYAALLLGQALPLPPPIAANAQAAPWLVVHIASGIVALLTAPWQFFNRQPGSALRLHRWTGRVYVAACTLGGLAGLVLAAGSASGLLAALGFGLLALLWLVTTWTGLVLALRGKRQAHRRWMVRSFALTLAAVTLRVYLPLAMAVGLPFALAYPVIAWLCWVPNLALAEWWLARAAVSS